MPTLVFTGGGTAGHVMPNLALAPRLREQGWDLRYVGSAKGPERGLAEAAGIPFHAIATGKLRRYFSVENFIDPFRVVFGAFEAFALLVMGGSLGSKAVNEALRENLDWILGGRQVVHLCGRGWLAPALNDRAGYRQFEFLGAELPDVLAAADLVVSRAGANSLFELLALRKPMLLIPLPGRASRGDQILNAESFAKRGLARVLPQDALTAETLRDALEGLARDANILRNAMETSGLTDGTGRVLDVIASTAG